MRHNKHLEDDSWLTPRQVREDVSNHILNIMTEMWGQQVAIDKLREFTLIEEVKEEDNDKNIHG